MLLKAAECLTRLKQLNVLRKLIGPISTSNPSAEKHFSNLRAHILLCGNSIQPFNTKITIKYIHLNADDIARTVRARNNTLTLAVSCCSFTAT